MSSVDKATLKSRQ